MDQLMNFGKSIRQFESSNRSPIFVEADDYPSFFNKHLVHPNRRIKIFRKDPNANIRAFYFQYLILCFEIQNPNYQLYVNKLHTIVLDPNFTFLFLQEDDEEIFNDKQFKRFILEFLQILDCGEFQSIETALNVYPVMDIVFVYFFRSLLIFAEITEDFDSYIDRNILFSFFMQSFKIDVAIFQERCLKFFEAEMFLYEENQQQIYMVYKQLQHENPSNDNSFNGQNYSVSSSQKDSIKQNVSMLQDYDNVSDRNQNSHKNSTIQKMANQDQNVNEIVSFKKNKQSQNNLVQLHSREYTQFNNSKNVQDYSRKQSSSQYEGKKYQPGYNNQEKRNDKSYLNANQNGNNRQGRTTRATTITGKDNEISPINSHDLGLIRPSRQNFYRDIPITEDYKPYNFQTNSANFAKNSQLQTPKSVQKNFFIEKNSYMKTMDGGQSQRTNKGTYSANIFKNQNKQIQTSAKSIRSRHNEFSDKIFQKLNVSKQFTDSLTLAKMGQPYKSHIRAIKTRSRQFRQSLLLHSFK